MCVSAGLESLQRTGATIESITLPLLVENILKIAETIVTLEIARPENNDTITRTLCITPEERDIVYLIDTDDWLNF